jgi:cobalt/nickel transport protein
MKLWQRNLILIVLVVALAAIPLWLCRGAQFGGADGAAEELILELDPEYESWFSPILEPASGEIESMLFALQAAIGAGVVGFVLGRLTSRKPEDGSGEKK